MNRRMIWIGVLVGVAAVFLAPIWILWCPGASSWRAHLFRNLVYAQIARRVTRECRSTEQVVERLAEYVHTHMWPATDVGPYDGKPLDYLVRGIGWCDYMAKAHMRLLATCRIPARYAMLRETEELSPHTVAEVWSNDRWGVYDLLFNIRFLDPDGKPLALEGLSERPELLDAQSMMAILRRQAPGLDAQIRELYARVLPVAVPPRRSSASTTRLTVFDHLVLRYARWGGQGFVGWYQDRYVASAGWQPAATAGEWLRLARHWHLAGRAARATRAYARCIQEHAGSPEASEARFWLGLLQWELEGDPAGALRTFEAGVRHDPNSRWAPMTWYYMGRCEEALGHVEEAQAWYAKAQAAGILAAAPRAVRLTDRTARSTSGRGIGRLARRTHRDL